MMKITTILFIINCLYPLAPSASSVKLEYTFKAGDLYEMSQKTDQTIKQSIMGMDQEGVSEYSGTLSLKVMTTTQQGATLEVRFIKLRNYAKNFMGETVMDSEGPQDNTQNKVFKSMMNKPFSLSMKRNGEIESVSGTENLWSDIGKLGLDEESVKTMKEVMGQFMNESSLKKSLSQSLVYYSDRKVKVGDTWTSANDFPMDFPIKIDNLWTLVNVSGGTASVAATGKYTTTDTQRIVTLPGGFKSKVDLSGTQELNAKAPEKTGWSEMTTIDSSLKGKMILQAGGMIPQDMEIPMEIKTKTVYTVIKK